MRTIRQAIVGAVVLLFTSAIHTFAIEGIQVSVQSSNVLLSWPSATNETYVIQSMGTLQATDMWLTLTDGFPASLNTNLTVFIESNAVQPPIWITNASGGGTNGGGGGMTPPGGTNDAPGMFGSTTGFYRVVRDGVHIFGLTNGAVLSGNVQQPIEFAVDSTDEIVGVSFYDTNANPVIGATAAPGPNGGWMLNWDTQMEVNGNYAIMAELDFGTDAPMASIPITVTVSNLISFPNYFTQLFGYQMWIYAQTIPNADVEIDIYDENTNYLGSFYPVSDSGGVISFIWDLTDGDGYTFPDTNFFGVWTVYSSPGVVPGASLKTIPSASSNFPLPSTKETLVKKARPAGVSPAAGSIYQSNKSQWNWEVPWTPNNNWVVAAGDFADLNVNPVADQVEDYIVYGGNGNYDQWGGAYGTLVEGHLNVGPPGDQNAGNCSGLFAVNSPASRNTLLSYLASTNPRPENLFWFGHGNDAVLSAGEAGTGMTGGQIAFALDNVPLSEATTHVSTHPYRFVWADACDTSKGILSESFSIPAKLESTNDFIAEGVWSRVFLGYTSDFHPDLGQDGYLEQESQIISALLSTFLHGKSGNSGTQYNMNTLAYDAHYSLGPFAGIPYWITDPTGVFGAGDLLYGDPW